MRTYYKLVKYIYKTTVFHSLIFFNPSALGTQYVLLYEEINIVAEHTKYVIFPCSTTITGKS